LVEARKENGKVHGVGRERKREREREREIEREREREREREARVLGVHPPPFARKGRRKRTHAGGSPAAVVYAGVAAER
jgi:LmbE family N-acetylglucosaminyl deacetylase